MLVEISPAANSEKAAAQMIEQLPVLVLNLHSRCNCRCVMCDIWKRTESSELPLEALQRHRDSLRSLKVQWVVLSGGEPLMHSAFPQLCSFLRELGIRITLLTAGISLQKYAAMVAHNVDDVIVSLDGPRAVHDHIRGVAGAYERLQVGVLGLLALRPEMRISARTTVQKGNHTALCATVEAAKELDLSSISFLPADLTSAAFNREAPWSESKQSAIGLSTDEIEQLEAEIEVLVRTCDREIRSGYIAESATKLRRIGKRFRAHLELEEGEAPMCNAPWVSAVIGHDGSVQPCFFHPSVGSIHERSLAEVINGQEALAFRANLDIRSNRTCQKCVCSLYRQ